MAKEEFTKRLASEILICGKHKIWIDPNETTRIKEATTRSSIKTLIEDGLIIKKPDAPKSRYNTRVKKLERKKGRHCGIGKRRGKKTARVDPKKEWRVRIKALRRILKKQREEGRVTREEYRDLYSKTKGNLFKNKKALLEYIQKEAAKKQEMKLLTEQMNAIKTRTEK
ncbi:MAG: 60S ribosomal protein L19 [Amphiamblys sp. WSBS2006]|nr:MAG: 60S ribosomal protein L19 [Amphiamblys sp. WSBS2006]